MRQTMYACSFANSGHSLRECEHQTKQQSIISYRNNDMRTISIFRDDFQSLNSVYIAYYVVQNIWPIFFDPGYTWVSKEQLTTCK
jgi:hypothetical protein